MSSALSLIVLGNVYFLGPVSNVPSVTPTSTPSSTISQEQPLSGVRRHDYSYTPGMGGHKVHTQAANWNTARKTCEAEGGHLAIINSVAESRIIAELFQKSEPHVGSVDSNYVHIGFHDLFHEADYVTIHSESLATAGFNEWASAEPNNDQDENCGSLYKDGKLNDISCEKSIAFVCEVPYVQENLIGAQ